MWLALIVVALFMLGVIVAALSTMETAQTQARQLEIGLPEDIARKKPIASEKLKSQTQSAA